jgi:hypothetical protein
MRNLPGDVPVPYHAAPDLLSQAANVLLREAARLPAASSTVPGISSFAPTPPITASELQSGVSSAALAGRVCPVTGAATPIGKPDKQQLRGQAHELMAHVLGMLGPLQSTTPTLAGIAPGAASAGPGRLDDLQSLAGHQCPITKAEVPMGGFDKDRLRRQAHAFIETLLITFNDATGEKGLPSEDQVPLIHCVAPVQPGGTGRASLRVTNEEDAPCEVTLYTSNFVADSGYEIPALRVSVTPRRASIPPNGDVSFEILLQISQQTPAGTYSGLIQAMGDRYVKAVLSVDVL